MGRQQPIGMYRSVKFVDEGPVFERHYRLANCEIIRSLKPRRGQYRHVTRWWIMHDKAKPGSYRKPRKLRNVYVINQD